MNNATMLGGRNNRWFSWFLSVAALPTWDLTDQVLPVAVRTKLLTMATETGSGNCTQNRRKVQM
jgi:hypothetical protein